ncbi:YbaB/EbfC family nucleoid-associated protein [Nonomuraea sp. NPDC046802]|uniref:YbaB/EbfC family nucleoid-associated protein n=1 Tax=Nonomuraea sp. NPDC046802 TaxID=3154919 RepID=UPI0033F2F097
MSAHLGAGDFDRLIEAARHAVDVARTVPAAPATAEYEAGRRHGLVRATAVLSPDGVRLRSLDLDPRARRLESAELAALILRTVNEAIEGAAGQARTGSPAPDLAALSAELGDLQALSADRFGLFADTITDLLRQLERRIDG